MLNSLITKSNRTQEQWATSRGGFTLIEVMIVTTLLGLLAMIAIPRYLRARDAANSRTCINNLKQIDSAIQQWATELRKPQSAMVEFSDIRPYLKGSVICPSGGTGFHDSYSISTVGDLPVCRKDPQRHIWPSIDVAFKAAQ